MKDKTRQKWQEGASDILEPGEQVQAGARGAAASYWQMVLLFGYLTVLATRRYRIYLVTDRNVYVCRGGGSKYKIAEVLEKRPLGSARVEFDKGYLSLDGEHRTFVAKMGPLKAEAEAVAEAATASLAEQLPAGSPA